MRTAIVLLAACAILAPAAAQTYVKPHVRKDGTYVEGHVRSSPNKTDQDNYSTRGNVNPYTSEAGTQRPSNEPYRTPPMSYGSSCAYTQAGNYVCK